MITRFGINKILAGLSRFASSILSPLLMPTYGVILALWVSVMCALPNGTRVMVVMVIMGITCVLPMMGIGVLHHFGIIGDKSLYKPRERRIPYIIAIVCYGISVWYMWHIHAPAWFVMFGVGGLLSLLVTTVVNMRWKISAHMTGIGGVVALVYQIHTMGLGAFELKWLLCIIILLAGVLGTARLILKCHTLPQVLTGFANGYVCVTLAMMLFG